MTILLRNGMNAYLCSALTMMATIAFSCFFYMSVEKRFASLSKRV